MSLDDYGFALKNYTSSLEFACAGDDDQKLERIKLFRDSYLSEAPNANVESVDRITEDAYKQYRDALGKGRAIPKLDNIILPDQEKGYKKLSKQERADKIEEFKEKIPGIAQNNPCIKEDTEFYLNEYAKKLERDNNHSDFILLVAVVCLVVLATAWTSCWMELRGRTTAKSKKKALNRGILIVTSLFVISACGLLYEADLVMFIPAPLILACAIAFIVSRYGNYCPSCNNKVWGGQCMKCNLTKDEAA